MSYNPCSMCGKIETCCGGVPNYAKLVDPYPKLYSTFLGDEPPPNPFANSSIRLPPFQLCVYPSSGAQPCLARRQQLVEPCPQKPCIINVPCDNERPSPKIYCELCPPPPPTKVWLIKSSPTPQKSCCLPLGGCPDQGNSPPTKVMVCVPCVPNLQVPQNTFGQDVPPKPIGLVTRCKEKDLIGGKFITKCNCGMRNGLAGVACPRISCQENPGCLMNPPRCWPQFKEPKPPPPPLPDQVCAVNVSLPFLVPGKPYNESPVIGGGKYLPPPDRRICPPHCLHVADLKGNHICTWHEGIPCIAHCFSTPLIPRGSSSGNKKYFDC